MVALGDTTNTTTLQLVSGVRLREPGHIRCATDTLVPMDSRLRKQQSPGSGGRTLNLPAQVFSKLSQEDRYLREQVAILKRETYYSLLNTVQKQQVVGKKLVRLEQMVARDKERSLTYSQRQVRTWAAPRSAPAFSQLGDRKLGATHTGWKSAPPCSRGRKAATPMCIRPSKRWATVEYFRELLRPSVLVCKQDEVKDDITYVSVAERSKSAMAQRKEIESEGRPNSRAYTPSQWNTISAMQKENKLANEYRRCSALHGKR